MRFVRLKSWFRRERQQGFTLLEIVITIAILVTMTMAVTTMLRSSFDVRSSLAGDNIVTHRFSIAIQKIANDLEHAFIISAKDQLRNGLERQIKTVFEIDKNHDSDKLMITTMNHHPIKANAKESSLTYVVYEVREDKKIPGLKHLYRGETPFIPESFKDDPPMSIIAQGIKSLKLIPWRGDDWVNDKWDTNRSEWRDKMPRMVRIELDGWAIDLEPEDTEKTIELDNAEMVSFKTVVFIQRAIEFPEIKEPMSTIRWF